MNILKSTLLVMVAVFSLLQTSNAKAEGMDIVRYFDVEREMTIGDEWDGHREIWLGHYVGKGHRLAVINFQGAKISSPTDYDLGVVGARIVDTRYYTNSGYVYAKIVLNGDTAWRYGLFFRATFNYNVTVYDGTYAGNAVGGY